MRALDLDNPAWRFALALYGKPGVAEECLRLQDETGLDVSFALVCLWLGLEQGTVLDEGALAAMATPAAEWCGLAVRPLRGVRRGLKASPLLGEEAVAGLRERVKAAELDAERIEIALLYAWAEERFGNAALPPGGPEAATANLALILARHGRAPEDAPALAAALAGMGGKGASAREEKVS